VLGLITLREGESISVYSTAAVRETLITWLRLDSILGAFAGVRWHDAADDFAPLLRRDGSASGLQHRAIPLPGEPPRFARSSNASPEGHSVAYQVKDEKTGGLLLVAPDVSALTIDLKRALQESDAVLFDGTFWSDDELQSISPGSRTAREMGHLPIGDGSLEVLRDLPAKEKIYLHINNTNPILAATSLERTAVQAAEIKVGLDGMELSL
jgi:pyrroloquinoline quinone biosynthesis protein B